MGEEPGPGTGGPATGPRPGRMRTLADLARELDRLRQRAARGSGRVRVSLDEIARRSGIPRSTVHAYVRGARLPPPDALDRIVVALGASPAEQSRWAQGLDRLADELSRDPAARTDRRPVATDAPVVPHQLPAAPAGFVGRTDELARLGGLVEEGRAGGDSTAVIAVTGTGGVGKTALVLHWGHRAARELFPDGELWLDLRGFSAGPPLDPADALERLLRGVGVGTVDLPNDVDARAAMFRTAVAGKRMLLVVDNARDSAHVRPLLPGTPGFVTVITSRDALRPLVAGEGARRLRVQPLPLSAAVELLSTGLPAAVGAALPAERIAAACDGLPLALRIVRERLTEARPGDLDRLVRDLAGGYAERLAALDVHDATGELSVRAAMEWSYRRLPPAPATLLRRLPLVLVPTVDLDVVAAVLDSDPASARGLLDVLVSANLIDAAGPDQYRVHDLVAAYAADRLAAEEPDAAVDEARIRLLEYLMSRLEAVLAVCDPSRPFRLPRPELPRAGLSPPVHPFATTAAAKDWTMGHAEVVVAAVLDAAARTSEYSWPLAERAWRALWILGNVGELEPALQAVDAAGRRAGAAAAQWIANRLLAITYMSSGRPAAAEEAFRRAIAAASTLGADRARVDVVNLAVMRGLLGDLASALETLRGVAAGINEVGADELPVLLSLVELELQHGDLDAARHWLDRVFASRLVAGQRGSFYLEAETLAASLAAEEGDLDAAADRLVRLEGVTRGIENVATLSVVLERLATVRQRQAAADAEALAREALQAAQVSGARAPEAMALGTLGDIVRAAGRPVEARRLHEQALARAREAQLRYIECRTLLLAAAAARPAGDVRQAAADAQAAREIAERCGYRRLAAEAAAATAEISGPAG